MRGRFLLITLLAVIMLTACGEEEPTPAPPVKHLRVQQLSYTWDGHMLEGISPVSAFEETGSGLMIFPYFDSNDYILIERIYLSNNNFWNSVSSGYVDTPNFVADKSFSLFTTGQGVSLGCVPIGENEGYIVRTETLSSAYVKKVCEILCQ